MTRLCPEVPDFARCSAREACELLGISFNTLKKYVRLGRITPGLFSDGTPYYLGREIKKLWREK